MMLSSKAGSGRGPHVRLVGSESVNGEYVTLARLAVLAYVYTYIMTDDLRIHGS